MWHRLEDVTQHRVRHSQVLAMHNGLAMAPLGHAPRHAPRVTGKKVPITLERKAVTKRRVPYAQRNHVTSAPRAIAGFARFSSNSLTFGIDLKL